MSSSSARPLTQYVSCWLILGVVIRFEVLVSERVFDTDSFRRVECQTPVIDGSKGHFLSQPQVMGAAYASYDRGTDFSNRSNARGLAFG